MAASKDTSANSHIAPRVFISYARSDGEQFAADLRQRLQAEHIPLWQDRVGMEGGRDWWQQITEALDKVEFMVLVMTPAAMQSEMVRREWRYARQQGVCVYPIKGEVNLDFNSLPHWMRSAHFYDLDHEWQKLLNDLNTRCQQTRVPFMVEDMPADYVARPREFGALINTLLDQQREEPIAITAALRGAGGYGKTTMAKALCHDERIQQAFDDGILWVTLGENPGNLVGKVEDLIYMLNQERPGFMGIDAAEARLAELLAERDILLVVDDVWDAMHLKPFLQGGKRCARLVTTRNEDVLPANAQSLVVDAMQTEEAVQLLSSGLQTGGAFTATDMQALRTLVERLGEWALLLKLANGVLRDRMDRGETLANALVYLNKALDKRGLTAFDAENAQARHAAVSATLRVSFELLHGNQYARYQELAVFPEDVDIPLATLQTLWGATGGLDDIDTEELCRTLYRHSLLLTFDLATRTIRLHDVIVSYLQKAVGIELPALHTHLLDAYALKRWADLPEDEPYLWDHLSEHLVAAGRLEEQVATVKDLRYLAHKTLVRSAYATEADLAFAEQRVPSDVPLRLLTRNFANIGHLLKCCTTYNDIATVLYSRLVHLQDLSDLCQAFEHDIPRPYLASWHLMPDLPDPALILTLSGHTSSVEGCAINQSGDTIVSASKDQTLKVWDAHTGEERLSLRGHTNWVEGCAISQSGDTIVSASGDQTLKVWDARTGEERLTLRGHTGGVWGCAISPAGDSIVSASADRTLKVWDARTGEERLTLSGHTDEVGWCAISPAGDFIVSASDDLTLKVWDARTGEERLTLNGHTDWVQGCAISPSGDFIVSASIDQTLKVWDVRTGEEQRTLRGHTGGVSGCAISSAGDSIVSGDWDGTLKVWDVRTRAEQITPRAHTNRVYGCAISRSGDAIVSASVDATLKVWDAWTGEEQFTLRGHTGRVFGCAISPSGDFIVSASKDQTLKVWDARTGEEMRTLRGHTDGVTGCAISPAGDSIVSASSDRMLKVWDAHTGEERGTLRGHRRRVNGCVISPLGDIIVSASNDNTLKVWDAHTGEELRTLSGHTHEVTGCVISSSGDALVSASYDQTLKVWDAYTGEEQRTLRGHTSKVTGCGISPSGDALVSASADGTLKVWNTQTGACLSTLYVNGWLHGCAFHPDGEHLVAVGASGVYFLLWVR